jgi:hypothetical protein
VNARDLIELLQDVDPDTEVRLAQQPRWPFEYSVGGVARVRIGGPDEGDVVTFEDDAGVEHTGEVKQTTEDGMLVEEENGGVRHVPFHQLIGYLELTEVLYIGEGTQLAYLPGNASRELGWR